MPFHETPPTKEVYGNKITKNNGYDHNSFTYIPVAIIGGGESGIAMGCQLKEQLGFEQFRIFERQSGWGGTWWINRYPGVACDIPAVFYSFSFAQNKTWTSLYPSGPEIIKYLDGVVSQYGLADKIQLNTDVTTCAWNTSEQIWELTTHTLIPGGGDLSSADRQRLIAEKGEKALYLTTEVVRAKVLISCVGGLVEPNPWPQGIPGHETFTGDIFHSARWRYDIDLRDKNVVVIGSGCSAAQFVPELPTVYGAKKVTQVMRTPPWVVPKQEQPFGDSWGPWLNTHIPGFAHTLRLLVAAKAEYDWRLFGDSAWSKAHRRKNEAGLLEHMRRTVPEKYWEVLTPNYDVACKRRIFDATWFPSLKDARIDLTTKQLLKANPRSVTLGARTYPPSKTPGPDDAEKEIDADVIILGNGFQTTQWFHPLQVVGRNGHSLRDVFAQRGGPQMYMGSTMDAFPNFFTIFGPNTATGHTSVVLASENMVNYTIKLLKPILKGDATAVEVTESAERAWSKDIQDQLQNTVWHRGGCKSWYVDDGGWNSTVYPYSQVWFGLKCMFPKWSDYTYRYTTKGLVKKYLRMFAKIALLGILVVVVRGARRMGVHHLDAEGWKLILRQVVGRLLFSGGDRLKVLARGVVNGER